MRIVLEFKDLLKFFRHKFYLITFRANYLVPGDVKEVTIAFYWPTTRLNLPITNLTHFYIVIFPREFSSWKFSHSFMFLNQLTYTTAIVSHFRVFHAHFWCFNSLISRWKFDKILLTKLQIAAKVLVHEVL